MKRNNSELKRLARETLTGHYGTPMSGMVLVSLIPNLLILPFNMTLNNSISQTVIFYIASLFISILAFLLSCGLYRMHLNMRRKQPYGVGDVFYFFSHHPDRLIRGYFSILGITILVCIPMTIVLSIGIYLANTPNLVLSGTESNIILIITILLAIVLLIPVVLVLYNYSLFAYLLIDDPNKKVKAALKESHSMMKGHRFHLFTLQLSFLGWFLLGISSCFIGFLWIEPYYEQTLVSFFFELTGETDRLEVQKDTKNDAAHFEAFC